MTSKRKRLKGPVFPVVTPFIKDASDNYPVDYKSLEKYVKYLLSHGAKIIKVASATSRFAQLELHEMKKINQLVVKTAKGKALTIASTPVTGPTYLHVEAAQHAEKVGADLIECEYPWRYQSDQAQFAYYRAIASATDNIGIMLHVTPARSELGGLYRYGISVLKKILAIPQIVGMKEASGDAEHSQTIWKTFAKKTDIIVAGRASETFLKAAPFGVSGFFVGTGSIVPKPTLEIYKLVVKDKLNRAKRLVREQETPFLDLAKKFGWHASLKSALHELKLMDIYERPPMQPLPLAQRKKLKAVMRECGWI